jgi:hypothetical protein
MPVLEATDKQLAFLNKLVAEKQWEAAPVAATVVKFKDGEVLGRKEVSAAIDQLMALKGPAKPKAAPVADGFYVLNDTIYKVQTSPNSGHSYAKKLSAHGSFDYAAGAIAKLATAEPLTLELAAKYGKLYGMCVGCGRTLTDEGSIAAGIGPICAGKF